MPRRQASVWHIHDLLAVLGVNGRRLIFIFIFYLTGNSLPKAITFREWTKDMTSFRTSNFT